MLPDLWVDERAGGKGKNLNEVASYPNPSWIDSVSIIHFSYHKVNDSLGADSLWTEVQRMQER